MNIGQGMVARAVVFGAAVGLSLAGIGFFAFGIFALLVPICGIGGAAFITAFVCMSIAALVVIALVSRTPQAHVVQPPPAVPVANNDHIINALSELAQEHPLMAVCCAAVLGATGGGAKPR